MPAPPALAVSKLSYRETKETKSSIHRKDGRLKVPLSDDVNVVEAAFKGAIFGMHLGLNIAAQFVAFLAIIEMLDEFTIYDRFYYISRYALAGFSNLRSIGVQLGTVGT